MSAAEKIGKQDERGFENAFAGSKILVILIGLTVVLVSILFGKPFFYAVYRQQGKELQELLGYFYPASFTVLQNMLIFQYSVYFKNRQNTKITLWVTVVSTTVNLFFDFVLVYGAAGFPRLGTAGAAWGLNDRQYLWLPAFCLVSCLDTVGIEFIIRHYFTSLR